MKCLESLYVSSTNEEDIIDLESMTCPPEFLRRLHLVGPLRKLPDWITKLQNLTKITVQCSKLEDDPLKVLRILPELVALRIWNEAFVGEQLHFEEGGFPKLKEVPSGIQHLRNLEMLMFIDMPNELMESVSMERGITSIVYANLVGNKCEDMTILYVIILEIWMDCIRKDCIEFLLIHHSRSGFRPSNDLGLGFAPPVTAFVVAPPPSASRSLPSSPVLGRGRGECERRRHEAWTMGRDVGLGRRDETRSGSGLATPARQWWVMGSGRVAR
ncbi:hypothetical protein TIFTF001_040448 [Ficus carica]|uniref:Disease resistance R13L4/SHOC-2-like LRR domain-containing protein n=1 Tax=Ficus carica TaxID=3494 RepID=A0AA87ZEV2_FICCA|nr:hypothetical protein TIFTF001_040448 [Ficus carica]